MNMVFRTVIFGAFSLAVIHCKSQGSRSAAARLTDGNDTIVKDIATFFQAPRWQQHFLRVHDLLDLSPIDKGFNEWQIRIWAEHGYMDNDSSQLFIFKKEANNITGNLYTYFHPKNSNWDTASYMYYRIEKLVPRIGWQSFIKQIEKLGIYELPDLTTLPNYYAPSGSYGVMIETATRSKYRIYEYPDYELYRNKIKEAGKMFKIMSLIEKEFDVKAIY